MPAPHPASDDPLDILEALIESNRQRAKNYEQIGREANALLGIEQARAKVRQQEHAKTAPGKKKETLVEPVPQVKPGKSRDVVGKKLGTSGKTAEAAGHVVVTIDTLTKAGKAEEARDKRIFDLWLACWTQEEIAEMVGCDKATISREIDALLQNGNSSEMQQSPSASHLVDFDPPLYNVWKQQEKTAGTARTSSRCKGRVFIPVQRSRD